MYTAHQRIMARLNSLNSFVDTHGDGRMQQTLVGGGGVEKKRFAMSYSIIFSTKSSGAQVYNKILGPIFALQHATPTLIFQIFSQS